MPSMRPCLSEATTMPSSFAEDVANFADAGCAAMEVWLTKLEKHLDQDSVSATHRLLGDRGMSLVAASYQGGLLLAQAEQRKAHYDHFRRRLDLCQEFGIPTMLVIADFVEKIEPTSLDRAVVSLRQAGQWAAGYNVTLALEFRARNTFCASLDTALALVSQCGEANVGINLDVFHYYTGPSKFEDFGLLRPGLLAFVQVSDLAGVPRELAADSDRILPGDGDFQLAALIDLLRKLPYFGWVSLELMNPILWQANPKQLVEIAYTSLRRLLGQADGAPSESLPTL
jgi:2-keto-myo-inositol isomerase